MVFTSLRQKGLDFQKCVLDISKSFDRNAWRCDGYTPPFLFCKYVQIIEQASNTAMSTMFVLLASYFV